MLGFNKPAAQPAGKTSGRRAAAPQGEGSGEIRGPGSSTSDSIKTAVPEGSYIMPADSTQAIGLENLEGLGFKPGAKAAPAPATEAPGMGFKPGGVPVNLSDGEFQLSPEQVHAIGAQVLEGLKSATHTPAAQQEREEPGEQEGTEPSRDELYFADGGMVEDKKRRPLATSPTNTFPGNRAEPTRGMYAGANADVGSFAKAAFPGTATAIQGAGQAIQDAYTQGGLGAAVGQGFRGAMVPAVGLADDVANSARRVLDPAANALKTLVTGDATPIGQAAAAAPAAAKPPQSAAAPVPAASAPTATPANPNYGNEPNAPANPLAAAPATSAPLSNNVTREGNSYSGKDIGPGFTINGKGPGGGSVSGAVQPGGFSKGVGGPDVLGILQRESQIRAGMGPLQDQIVFNSGSSAGNGIGFRKIGTDEAIRDMVVKGNSRDRATALGFMGGRQDAEDRFGISQQELAIRQQDTLAKQGIAEDEMDMKREAQGFQSAALRRQEALQARYEAAKTPEERAAIAQQIRDLSGKQEPQNRFTVVPGGQEWDAASGAMRNVPARVLNNQTGQFVDQPQATMQPQAMPMEKSKLSAGQIYQTARGPARWDGNQFVGV